MTERELPPPSPPVVRTSFHASFSARTLALVTDGAIMVLVLLVFLGTALEQLPGSGPIEAAAMGHLPVL
jgi:hypothetical protein